MAWWGVFAGALLFAAAAYVAIALLRSLPQPSIVPTVVAGKFHGRPSALAWPRQGEAAIGVEGVGLIGSHGANRPVPMASVAKVMTAYLVLGDHPLPTNAGGRGIVVGPGDVAVYHADLAAGQSVVNVRRGERISERQALEGLLLPSGNNIAALLARWDAGSQAAFVAKMNARARALGLRHTHYADASGVDVGTVSTAADQARIGMRALEIPSFRQIVALRQVTLPVAGTQYNLNGLVGKEGIFGIKTGSTSRAGGCFVFAAHRRIAGRTVTVVGAVLHQLPGGAQPSIIAAAFTASTTLLGSVNRVLVKHQFVRRHATLGWVDTPWAGRVRVVAAHPVSLLGWPGLRMHATIASAPTLGGSVKAGDTVGTELLGADQERARVRLVATHDVPQASLTWRLSHP